MNYFDARQLRGGGWHYTVSNDDRTHRAASCVMCSPHPTEEAARECAATWIVDHAEFVHLSTRDSVPRCAITTCESLVSSDDATPNAAAFGFGMGVVEPLCDEHLSRDGVRLLVGHQAGWVASS